MVLKSIETAYHSVQARICALRSWRLDLLACNKGKWTVNKGTTTLKRLANLFPSPNIPPRHLPDCLGHTWLQTSPLPFPDVPSIYSNISFLPTQGRSCCPNISYTTMGFKPHSGCDVIPDVPMNLIKAQTTPLPFCRTCDVTSPIPGCA